MIVETVRVSEKAKDQLIQLKRITGIQNWNVLCRWALCISLAEPKPLSHTPIGIDNAIVMDWRTFAGKDADAYEALIKIISNKDSSDPAEFLIRHIHRGIIIMCGSKQINSIESLLKINE